MANKIKTQAFTWRAVTIDGKLWAYRMEIRDGQYTQYTPASLRAVWWGGDVMQYFNPEAR